MNDPEGRDTNRWIQGLVISLLLIMFLAQLVAYFLIK